MNIKNVLADKQHSNELVVKKLSNELISIDIINDENNFNFLAYRVT